MLTARVHFEGVEELFGELKEFATLGFVPFAAEIAKRDIIRKTQEGLSWNNTPFGPYSQAQKDHRIALGKQTGHVDETITGSMLNSLSIQEVFFLCVSGEDENSVKNEAKMMGQMFHPKWQQHYDIMGIGEDTQMLIVEELESQLIREYA